MRKIIITLLLLAACSSGTSDITLGVNFPMTGDLSVYGESLFEGLQMGIGEVNSANGRQIKLLLEDNTGDGPNSVTIAQKMIDIDDVDMMLTTILPMSGAVAPVADANQEVMLYAAAVDSIAENHEWVFKDSVDSYYDCTLLAEYALRQGHTTFAILGAHAEFTEKCKEALDEVLPGKGKLVSYDPYPIGERDYRTILTKIKSKNPNVVIVPSFSGDCIQIWKQVREIGLNAEFMLPFTQSGCGELKAMEELKDFDSPVIGLEFMFDANGEKFKQFMAKFKGKYGKEPALLFFAMLGYDWAHYIAEAFEKCEDPSNSHCLRAALEETNYDGVLGHVEYKPEHTTFRPRKLIEWKNNKWVDKPTTQTLQ